MKQVLLAEGESQVWKGPYKRTWQDHRGSHRRIQDQPCMVHAEGSRVILITFGPCDLTPIAGSIWGILILPQEGWVKPCCSTHRREEMKGPQLPGTLEIAQCLSRSALQKAEDFCTDFLILQGEKKKIESFWALLHN